MGTCKIDGFVRKFAVQGKCDNEYVLAGKCRADAEVFDYCKRKTFSDLPKCSDIATGNGVYLSDTDICGAGYEAKGRCIASFVDNAGNVYDTPTSIQTICKQLYDDLPDCIEGIRKGYLYDTVALNFKCSPGMTFAGHCATGSDTERIQLIQCVSNVPANELNTCENKYNESGFHLKPMDMCTGNYYKIGTCYVNGEKKEQCKSETIVIGANPNESEYYPSCNSLQSSETEGLYLRYDSESCEEGDLYKGKCKTRNSISGAEMIAKVCSYTISPTETPAQPGSAWSGGVVIITPTTTSSILGKVFNWKVQALSSDYLMYTQDGQLVALESGKYVFKYKGKTYYVELAKGTKNRIFLDENKNGIKDKDEKYLDEVTKVTQLKIGVSAVKYKYTLEPGYNFVHFPFAFDKPNLAKASNFLKFLRTQGNVSMISYFDGRWHTLDRFALASVDQAGYAQDGDFTIVPGRGYVIRNMGVDPITFTVEGKPIKQVLPVNLIRGWNLVGFYNPNKTYTASSLVKSMNSTGDLNVVNVTKWQSGRYDGVQQQNDKTYGFDFPILWDVGYFVNVKDIKTTDKIYTWQDK